MELLTLFLTTTPVSVSIAAGGSVGYPKVSVSRVNGFNGTVIPLHGRGWPGEICGGQPKCLSPAAT